MSIISSVSHAQKTWLPTVTSTLAVVTLSSAVGVLTTPLFAFITAAVCTLITAAGFALARAARTVDTIFAEELGTRPSQQQAVMPLKTAQR